MIINIPLSIPDEMLENTIAKDYEAKITERLTKEVRDAICKHDAYRDKCRGLDNWVGNKIEDIIKEYKDEIIEAAANKLAERLARSKKGKALLGEE